MATPIVDITPKAVEQVSHLLAKRGKPSAGIKIGVRTRGCSGLSYTMEYADEITQYDEVVSISEEDDSESDAMKLIIDPKAIMFILGMQIDFKKDKLQSGFTFTNPNEKGRCGCGESFTV